MEAKRALHWDVLDCDAPAEDADLTGPAAAHALLFGRAWHSLFGCMPAGTVHSRYCGGRVPREPLDQARFAAFVAGVARMPVSQQALQKQAEDTEAYRLALADPDRLRADVVAKLCDRYDAPDPSRHRGASLARAHAEIRAAADMNELGEEVNPVTGHHVGSDPRPFAPCRREAWRSAMSRDMLFASQACQTGCVFLDSSASGRIPEAAAIASEAAAAWQAPIVVMSDCSKALRELSESLDFYHYPYHVPCPDAYMAAPRLFRAFVMVGGSAKRPPLCRSRPRCWHYLPGGDGGGDAYTDVVDRADLAAAATDLADGAKRGRGRVAYYAPPMLPPGGDGAKEFAVGFHPDTADKNQTIRDAAVVPPERAHLCGIYVSCASQEGVERCMAAGGRAVARDFGMIDDGINGFLSGELTAAAVNAAIVRALGSDGRAVGKEAARVGILFGERTFRWLWRGLLSRGDPVASGDPRDAASLHERFLALSAATRYREIARYRATTCRRKAVVFLDNRPDVGTALAVLVTTANLRAGWGVVGFVGEESRAFFAEALDHLGSDVVLETMRGFRSKSHFIEQYNSRFKSPETWLKVAETADHCLTVQSDGLLVRPGIEGHECANRDYCGARWLPNPYLEAQTKGNLVGNGGFSFRSVHAMLKVCRERGAERHAVYPLAPAMSVAEDVYFAARVADPCPAEHADTFSMEQAAATAALGYHRFWAYHPVEFTAAHFEKLLEEAARVPSTADAACRRTARPLSRRPTNNIL